MDACQDGGGVPADAAGEELAAWLKGALYDAAGRRKMTDAKLMERARISKNTLYPLLSGKLGGADDATLAKIAKVLGVPAPRVARLVTYDPPPPPETPGAILRAAQNLLERLGVRLEATSAGADTGDLEAEQILEQEETDPGVRPPRPGDRRVADEG